MKKRILSLVVIAFFSIITAFMCSACNVDPQKVTITYYVDDNVWDQLEVNQGDLIFLPTYDKETETHYYQGWKLDGQDNVIDSKTYIADDNISFVANKVAKAVVNYKMDGKIINTKYVKQGEQVTLPEPAEDEKYYCTGWQIEGTDTLVEKYTVNEDITFVATGKTEKAILTYKIAEDVYATKYAKHGELVDLITVENTDTKVFGGWKVNGEGSVVSTYEINNDITFIGEYVDSDWIVSSWKNLTNFDASNIWAWTDNGEEYTYYYSNGHIQYELDLENKIWREKQWNGVEYLDREYIWCWTDGVSYQYYALTFGDLRVYQLIDGQWADVTKNGKWDLIFYNQFSNNKVYTIDGEFFAITENGNYVFDGKEWKLDSSLFSGMKIDAYLYEDNCTFWTDGTSLYCYDINQQVEYIRGDDNTWTVIDTQFPEDDFNSACLWSDNNNTYYTRNGNTYLFDKDNKVWSIHKWISSFIPKDGSYIWSDGVSTYYNCDSENYMLNQN